MLHENLLQWDETKENGLVVSYSFPEKDEFRRADYQIYWNAKPTLKDNKWLIDIKETDGKSENKKSQQLLNLFTEKYGLPLKSITLDKLESPNGSVMAQWYPTESEKAQGSLVVNFYRQTNSFYGDKEIYGVDITVSEIAKDN